jgi:hypothetical protein
MNVKVFVRPPERVFSRRGAGELFDCDSDKFCIADAAPRIGRANDAVPGFRSRSIRATLAADTQTAE